TIDAVLTHQPVADTYSIDRGGDAYQQIVAIMVNDDIVGMDAILESHHAFEIVDRVLAVAKPEVVNIVAAAVLKMIVTGTAVELVILVRAEYLIIAIGRGQCAPGQFLAPPYRAIRKMHFLDAEDWRPGLDLADDGQTAAIRQRQSHVALRGPAHGHV